MIAPVGSDLRSVSFDLPAGVNDSDYIGLWWRAVSGGPTKDTQLGCKIGSSGGRPWNSNSKTHVRCSRGNAPQIKLLDDTLIGAGCWNNDSYPLVVT